MTSSGSPGKGGKSVDIINTEIWKLPLHSQEKKIVLNGENIEVYIEKVLGLILRKIDQSVATMLLKDFYSPLKSEEA